MAHIAVGFWGLSLTPGETYTQEVSTAFRVTMAAYGAEAPKAGDRSAVQVEVDEQTHTLCALLAGKTEQQQLDIAFLEGEEVTFTVTGKSVVHLTGNYIMTDDGEGDFDDEDSEDSGEEDDFELIAGGEDSENSEEELEEARIEEILEEAKPVASKKRKEAPAPAAEAEPKLTKNQKRRLALEAKEAAAAAAAAASPKAAAPKAAAAAKEAAKPAPKEAPKPQKRTLASGVVVEDIEVGKGAKATRGKRIGMRYIGRLVKNGKVFDKNTSGAPFYFKLGVGEVIRGWDVGVEGMAVGGKRQITIPAAAGYGRNGAPPDIPKNADLQFDVQLVKIQ